MNNPDDGSSYSTHRSAHPLADNLANNPAHQRAPSKGLPVRSSTHAWQLVLLSVAVFIAVPLVIVLRWQHLQSLLLLITAIAAFIMLLLCFRHSSLPGLAVSLCLLLVVAHLAIVTQQRAAQQMPTDVVVIARVLSIPSSDYRRSRAVFNIEAGKVCRFDWLPCRATLSWYRHKDKSPPTLIPGQRWQFTIRVKAPRGYANPGGFDYAQWLARHGVQTSGYVRAGESIKELKTSWRGALSRWRLSVANGIELLLPGNSQLGLIKALAVGIRDGVERQQKTALIQTGTAHLLAISGMLVGMVASAAFMLGSLLWRLALLCLNTSRLAIILSLRRGSHRPKSLQHIPLWIRDRARFAAMVALLSATIYALLAGFTLPTQRALLTLLVVYGLFLSARRVAFRHVLMTILLLALLFDPLASLSASVWLSFGAVAALMWIGSGRITSNRRSLAWPDLWRARILEGLRIQFYLSLILVPVTIAWFDQASLVAPLANLLAIPLVALCVLPLILLGLLVMLFSSASAQWFLLLAAECLEKLLQLLSMMASVPFAQVYLPGQNTVVLGFALLAVLCVTKPRGGRLRWLAIPLCLPLLTHFMIIKRDGLIVHVLDVGQGLAVVVEAGRRTLLYDTGPGSVDANGQGYSAFNSVILPFLRTTGIGQPDLVIISHSDNDHAGGLAHLKQAFPEARVLAPTAFREELDVDGSCQAGRQWIWQDVEFTVVHPPASLPAAGLKAAQRAGKRLSDNNLSCVVLIRYGNSEVLLPGDIEGLIEQRLLSRLPPFEDGVDLLLAPHHGSRSSSTAAFLAVTQPRHVVFATGWANRYGFPDSTVVMRYKQMGAAVFQTDLSGALRFEFDRSGLLAAPHQQRQQ